MVQFYQQFKSISLTGQISKQFWTTLTMGHNNTKTVLQTSRFDINEYELADESSVCNIWRNTDHPLQYPQIQQYRSLIQTLSQLEHELDTFEFRKHTPHIVVALRLNYQQQDELCSRFYRRSLFVERIYLRLSDLEDISEEDSIYMMVIALTGFKKLFDRFGYFRVTEAMIGIDLHCMVKVWASENYGSASPDFRVMYGGKGEGSEKDLAGNIVNLIWSKTQHPHRQRQTPYEFMLQMYNSAPRKHQFGLKQAFYSIIEYALKYNIKYSRDMSSVFPIISQLKSNVKCSLQQITKQITGRRNSLESKTQRESIDRKFAQLPTMFTTAATNTTHSNVSRGKPQLNTSRSVDRCQQKSEKNDSLFESQTSEAPARIPSCIQPSIPPLNLNLQQEPLLFRPPTTRARVPTSNPFQKPPIKPPSTYRFNNATNRVFELVPSRVSDRGSNQDFLGSLKNISAQKLKEDNLENNSPNQQTPQAKFKYMKEVTNVAEPIQFSNKLARLKSPKKQFRVKESQIQEKKCRVIEVDTIDSPIKEKEESLSINPRDDSLYVLLDSLKSRIY